jgi:anti-anti-sigma factor
MDTGSARFIEFAGPERSLGLAGVVRNMAEEIDMEITTEAKAAVVAFRSPCMSDVDGIALAATRIKQFAEAHQPRTVIFDFEQVKFFSSQVLGLLLDVRQNVIGYGGEAVVSGINPQLHRVFKITNLDKVFRFFTNRRDAVEAANTEQQP